MAPKVYLITGCSSGFGEIFVKQILAHGDKVIATARNSSRLSKLQEIGASVIDLDVTWAPEKIQAAIDAAIKIYGHVDILINNAGYVLAGIFEETTYVRSHL
jgi:NADP-dependent 3-hydroxy acid dehydrogenase YdfG